MPKNAFTAKPTYNFSQSFTVFDDDGKPLMATIYYQKNVDSALFNDTDDIMIWAADIYIGDETERAGSGTLVFNVDDGEVYAGNIGNNNAGGTFDPIVIDPSPENGRSEQITIDVLASLNAGNFVVEGTTVDGSAKIKLLKPAPLLPITAIADAKSLDVSIRVIFP